MHGLKSFGLLLLITVFIILMSNESVTAATSRDRYKGSSSSSGSKKVGSRTETSGFDDDNDNIFELIIPKNDPTNACIKMNASFHFSVTYQAQSPNGTYSTNTVNFTLTEHDNFTFTGLCRPEKNMIELQFFQDWRLELYFYRAPETFLFNHVVLYYKLSGAEQLFPGAIHAGAQSELYDSTFINSTISKSYRCISGVEIDLSEVKIYIRNLTLEPFFNKRPNLPLDPAIECPQDRHAPTDVDTTSMWILVAIAAILAIGVLLCTWFICYKVRTDYLAIKNDRDVLKSI